TGEELPGEVDTVVALVEDPPFGDPSIQVAQVGDGACGQAPMLEGLGHDRGIDRKPGEPIEQYRIRVRRLPDTVSPAAIRRMVDEYRPRYGAAADVIETFSLQYQSCYDGSPTPGPATPQGFYDPNLFVYDDPRPAYPFRNRWLDEVEQ